MNSNNHNEPHTTSTSSTFSTKSSYLPESYYSNSLHFLRIFLNYAFYIGLSPFRFKEASTGLIMHTNKFQQVVCLIIYLTATTNSFRGAFVSWPKSKITDSPWILMDNALTLLMQSYFPILIVIFWFKRSNFERFFKNFMRSEQQDSKDKLNNATSTSKRKWGWKQAILAHIVGCMPMVVGIVIFIYYFNEGSVLGVARISSNMTTYSTPQLAIFEAWTSQFGAMMVIQFEQIPVLSALTLYQISIEFETVLNDKWKPSGLVLKRYFLSHHIIEHLNSIFSLANLINSIIGILYYSLSVIMSFDSEDLSERIGGVAGGSVRSLAIILAASSSSRIMKIKKWIVDQEFEKSNDDGDELGLTWINDNKHQHSLGHHKCKSLLYQYISDQPIGINCGSLFTLTYNAVAAGLGLLATYTIIFVQLYTTPSKVPPSTRFFGTPQLSPE